MPADDVSVVFRKYDGSLHWHMTMRRLGEDGHGVWLGAQAGASAQRADEPPITFGFAHVQLLPRDAWWTAVFNAPPSRTEIYCDVTTPPTWPSPNEVTMIDLDLDVIRRRTGLVEVDDEDEFAEHQVTYGYPIGVVAKATEVTRWLTGALSDSTEPFASAYREWLSKVA
jgi:uncharacterized protein